MVAFAKAGFNEGVEWYEKRHTGSDGVIASEETINRAIEVFSSAMILSTEHERDAALYLLKSYYYKAEFAIENKDDTHVESGTGGALLLSCQGEKARASHECSTSFSRPCCWRCRFQ